MSATAQAAPATDELLACRNLRKVFGSRRRGSTALKVTAVDGVDLSLKKGATAGLVGESGCGKSTTGRMLVRLLEPDGGLLAFRGKDITHVPARDLHDQRHALQMVFQDPSGSLNRRWTVERTLVESLRLRGVTARRQRDSRVAELLFLVGLSGGHRERYPHELSGGQRQRVGIARALAVEPEVIVLDEPVSALDVSVQAQVLNLLEGLGTSLGLSYLFISHDLSVVAHIADDVSVMYAGRIVETGPTAQVMASPAHPYTKALLSAVPQFDRARRRSGGRIVLPRDHGDQMIGGCPFRTRCWKAAERCAAEAPPLTEVAAGRLVACHFPEEP